MEGQEGEMLLEWYQARHWNVELAALIGQTSGREDGAGVTSSPGSSWVPGSVRFRVHGLPIPRRQQNSLPAQMSPEDYMDPS